MPAMAFDLSIDRDTGTILIGTDISLGPGVGRDIAAMALAPLIHRERDLGNGYVWLDLAGLLFGGLPCAASLCFHDGKLRQMAWGVTPAGTASAGPWPTRAAIDDEIAFVRATTRRDLVIDLERGDANFPWGTLWSRFDAKGYLASNGLRYAD